jgi:hypothetical protein
MAHTRYQDTESTEAPMADEEPAARPWAGLSLDPTNWGLPGLFVAVSVVVGLLGILIAGQVEPLVHPATPTASPAASVSPTTIPSSAADSATTIPGDESTASTVAALDPGKIELSTETVDFGSEGIATEFEMTNTGQQTADWTAVSSSQAIAFSASTGSLPAGETVTLRVSLDRSLIEEGELSESITIDWSEGESVIAATGSKEDNPIIHNPQAKPAEVSVNGGDGCSPTQTTVSARVRDTSEIESVVVRWSPDGSVSQETAMISVGSDMFEGVIGPFTAAQSASVRVVAFDVRGNAGGASITLPVNACPSP